MSRTVKEIYKDYPVHLGLQEHMIRVAAVTKMIADTLIEKCNDNSVVTAALLHDMGNLIKAKPGVTNTGFEPEGADYWIQKKEEAIETYGTDVHRATLKMVEEITSDLKVVEILKEAEFERLPEVSVSGSVGAKILEYADMRVGLYGIVSLEDRFADLAKRYVPHKWSEDMIKINLSATKSIEKELFNDDNFCPEEITDESTRQIQEELWYFSIE